GTALVALAAHTHNVPVLVACETYKFFDDVRLDSVVNNVLGKAHDLVMLPSHPDASSNGLEAMQYAANPVNAHTAWPALNNTRTASDSISFTSIPDLADEPTEPRFFSHTRILTRRHALDLLTGRHTVLGADAASTPGSQRAEHSALDATSAARVWTDFEDANPLAAWREIDNLKVLNLAYDVTPSSFISVVITELGLIPTTSVPVPPLPNYPRTTHPSLHAQTIPDIHTHGPKSLATHYPKSSDSTCSPPILLANSPTG
ncbi:Translation initiation factor eIF-2B subunit delta, partial [Zancudomyces culisetae]